MDSRTVARSSIWNRSDITTYNDQLPPSPLHDRGRGDRRPSLPHAPTSFGNSLSSSYSGDTLNSDGSRGVRLFEVIAPGATPLQRRSVPNISRSAIPSSATLHATAGTSSINRGEMGTLRRMSMRGKKPTRVIKNLVVNKTDAKSYFSSERTMYAWMYSGTIILGISLTIYRYIGADEKLAIISGQTGTLLSGLSLVIFYYAAFHFFWRRRALNRGAEAQAFDDKLGPILVVSLLCVGLTAYTLLTWINPIPGLRIKLHFGSFVGRQTDGYILPNGTRVEHIALDPLKN